MGRLHPPEERVVRYSVVQRIHGGLSRFYEPFWSLFRQPNSPALVYEPLREAWQLLAIS
jgi:hypothetical protein